MDWGVIWNEQKKFYDPYKNSCETLINMLKN